MKTRKIFSLIALTLALLMVLSACGGNQAPASNGGSFR